MGWLTVQSNPASAEISILGRTVGAGRTVALVAGTHRVALSAAGYQPHTDSIDVTAGRSGQASFALSSVVIIEREVPAIVTPPEEPTFASVPPTAIIQPVSVPSSSTDGWTLVTVGGTGMLVGGVLLGLSRASASAANALASSQSNLTDADRIVRYNRFADEARDLERTGAATLRIGAAVAIGGTLWLLLHSDDETAAATAVPSSVPAPTGLSVRGNSRGWMRRP
ncbi:MAG: hypothetical protein ACI9MR_001834 [Myxococcota bacterium]|jgi:hypothetical protein